MGKVKNLTFKEAYAILQSAVRILGENSEVATVVLMDRHQEVIAMAIMDGVTPSTRSIAYLKARQPSITGKSTEEMYQLVQNGERTAKLVGICPEELVPFAGGHPIYDQDRILIGGIGISNLAAERDAAVAQQAVEENKLKVVK